ncbi:hypothetical protein QJQ45_017269, partial [Haematococcus lacustris]
MHRCDSEVRSRGWSVACVMCHVLLEQVRCQGAVAPSISQKQQPQRQPRSSLLPPPSSLLAPPSSLLPHPSSLLPTTLPTTTCQIPHSPSPSPKGMIKGPHGASCVMVSSAARAAARSNRPPSPSLHSTPLSFPMPLLPPPPHLLPLTSFPHTPLLLLSLTLTQARSNME